MDKIWGVGIIGELVYMISEMFVSCGKTPKKQLKLLSIGAFYRLREELMYKEMQAVTVLLSLH